MAAPTTKESWWDYCAQGESPGVQRPYLTRQQRMTLDPHHRKLFDQTRFDYILTDRAYRTENVAWIEKKLVRMLQKSRYSTPVVRRALRVSGPCATGKSTALLSAGRTIDARLRRDHHRVGDRQYLPVIYISIGDVTSVNKLWACFGEFLGIGPLTRGNSDARLYVLAHLLREMGTRFVLVDEVQHLQTQKTQGAEAANALKRFAEHTDATMVYCGIDLDTAPLYAGTASGQWRARSVGYTMRTYSTSTAAELALWTNLINEFEADLPLCDQQPGSLSTMQGYLFARTAGNIGSLKHLLIEAALDAIDSGVEQLTRAVLDAVEVDLAAASWAGALARRSA